MLIIVLKLPVALFALEDETAIDEEYCGVSVNLTKPFVFLTKLGVEPVPNSMISKILLNELLLFVIKLLEIVVDETNWVSFVTFIDADAFVVIVGIEPVPFAIIFVTISNPVVTLPISAFAGVTDDVICVPPNTFTPLFVFFTIVGITPTPFDIILITFPKLADTNVLSFVDTDIDDVVCVSFVALIPSIVFDTNDGYPAPPLSIILETASKLLSTAISPIAITFVNSLA